MEDAVLSSPLPQAPPMIWGSLLFLHSMLVHADVAPFCFDTVCALMGPCQVQAMRRLLSRFESTAPYLSFVRGPSRVITEPLHVPAGVDLLSVVNNCAPGVVYMRIKRVPSASSAGTLEKTVSHESGSVLVVHAEPHDRIIQFELGPHATPASCTYPPMEHMVFLSQRVRQPKAVMSFAPFAKDLLLHPISSKADAGITVVSGKILAELAVLDEVLKHSPFKLAKTHPEVVRVLENLRVPMHQEKSDAHQGAAHPQPGTKRERAGPGGRPGPPFPGDFRGGGGGPSGPPGFDPRDRDRERDRFGGPPPPGPPPPLPGGGYHPHHGGPGRLPPPPGPPGLPPPPPPAFGGGGDRFGGGRPSGMPLPPPPHPSMRLGPGGGPPGPPPPPPMSAEEFAARRAAAERLDAAARAQAERNAKFGAPPPPALAPLPPPTALGVPVRGLPPPPLPPMTPAAGPWRVFRTPAPENTEYYFNTLTNQTQWVKPDELKTPDERAHPPCPWAPFKTDEGETYYAHAVTKEAVWVKPPELIEWESAAARRKAEALAAAPSAPPVVDLSAQTVDQRMKENAARLLAKKEKKAAKKAAASEYANPWGQPAAAAEPAAAASSSTAAAADEADDIVYASKDDARAAFRSLLHEKRITSRMKNFTTDVLPLIQSDPRFRALKPMPEKKKAYLAFMEEVVKIESEQRKAKAQEMLAAFQEQLKETIEITHKSRFKTMLPILELDDRYQALHAHLIADRIASGSTTLAVNTAAVLDRIEELFYSHVDSLLAAEKAREQAKRDVHVAAFKALLREHTTKEAMRTADQTVTADSEASSSGDVPMMDTDVSPAAMATSTPEAAAAAVAAAAEEGEEKEPLTSRTRFSQSARVGAVREKVAKKEEEKKGKATEKKQERHTMLPKKRKASVSASQLESESEMSSRPASSASKKVEKKNKKDESQNEKKKKHKKAETDRQIPVAECAEDVDDDDDDDDDDGEDDAVKLAANPVASDTMDMTTSTSTRSKRKKETNAQESAVATTAVATDTEETDEPAPKKAKQGTSAPLDGGSERDSVLTVDELTVDETTGQLEVGTKYKIACNDIKHVSVNPPGEVTISCRSCAVPYRFKFESIPRMAEVLDPVLTRLRKHQETGVRFKKGDDGPLGIANVWPQKKINIVQVIWSTKATTMQSWKEFKLDLAKMGEDWTEWVEKMKSRSMEEALELAYEFKCQGL